MKGLGIDIVSVSEMQETLDRAGEGFLSRVFSREERDAFPGGADRARHIASRFAVKEAVFKALGASWTPDASFADIVVGRCEVGGPAVTLRGDFAGIPAARGASTLIVSLSVAADTAVAVAALD